MQDVNHFLTIVEEAIGKLGIDPKITRTQQKGQWVVQKGTATIAIDIFTTRQVNGPLFFGVMSPIMKVPESDKIPFFQEILSLNHQMINAAFSVQQDHLFIRATRRIDGMDQQEAFDMITMVGQTADDYDERLQAKYPHRRPIGFVQGQGASE